MALKAQHKVFAEAYVSCLNGAEAARTAGYAEASAKIQAHKLLKRDDVQAYISELMNDNRNSLESTASEFIRTLKDIMYNGERDGDRIQAAKLLMQYNGMLVDRKQIDMTSKVSMQDLTDEQIDQMYDEMIGND